jgi:SAM-dependent methyltransferase
VTRRLVTLADRVGERIAPHRWRRLRILLRRMWRPARLGSLGQIRPLSSMWGFDRGTPVDRYYIEAFLAERRSAIRGRVLEVKDRAYTTRFGSDVEAAEVLDIDRSNPQATITADLSAAHDVADNQFDCFILTQTLQFIYDTRAALEHAHRILRPGGVLLATLPAVSRLAPRNGLTTDFWRFTPASCTALFEGVFGAGQVEVRAYGNLTSAIAFLAGAAVEELPPGQLDTRDDYYPVLIGVGAKKRGWAAGADP